MKLRVGVSISFALLGLIALQACGGGSSSPLPATISSVSVSPSNTNVVAGQSQQFTASVSGTGNFSSAVTWYVNSIAGGNSSVGTISATGLYRAPSSINAALSVTIMATSVADATKSGNVQANIVLGLVSSVTISPSSQNVTAGSSQMF